MEKRQVLADEAQSCSEQGNGYPLCQPVSTDTWINGSSHQIIWNYNYPYYVTSNATSIYLYNIIRYSYVSVKNYTNIDTTQGGLDVQVDDSWFLDPASTTNQSIPMYLYILPSSVDPYSELANSKSMYPRPFNFTVLQIASPNNGTTMSSSPSNNSNNTNSRLPGWAIAVICIAAFAILFGAIALVYAMMITRRNKKRKTPINPTRSIKKIITKKEGYQDPNGSHAHINGFRSSDSVQMMQSAATSVNTLPKAPSPIFFEHQQKMQLPDDWSNPFADEEERRRKLGESLLQRQLEEDGTSVKHAGRFTRVRSVAELPKSASMVEHPRYP